MRRIRGLESTPHGVLAVAEDGTLWLGVMEGSPVSITWHHLPGPPDGAPGARPKVRPLPNMVVGAQRQLTPDDLTKFGRDATNKA